MKARPTNKSPKPEAKAVPFKVRLAKVTDTAAVSLLFDAYRVFYRKKSDPSLARKFISARLKKGDSTLLLAESQGVLLGFTQLYPSFSSTSAAPILILNDLFVAPMARKHGVGAALMLAAKAEAKKRHCVRLELATERSNRAAQKLYDQQGYQKNQDFFFYSLSLKP